MSLFILLSYNLRQRVLFGVGIDIRKKTILHKSVVIGISSAAVGAYASFSHVSYCHIY